MAPNRWTTFVKEWAADNNVSYMCALTDPELKKEYNKFYTPAAKKELRNEANRRRRKEKTESGMMEEEDINRAVRRRTLPDTTQLEKDIAKLRKKAPEMLFEAAKSKSKKNTLPNFGEFPTATELKAQFAPKKTTVKNKPKTTILSKKFTPPKHWIAITTNDIESIPYMAPYGSLDGLNGKILFFKTKSDTKRNASVLRRQFAKVEASSDPDPYPLISMLEELGVDMSGINLKGGALIGRQPYVEGGCMMCGGKLTGKKIVKGLKKAGKATASALLHYGLPATLGVAGEMMGGPAGAAFGSMAGDMIADKVGEKTGYGLRRQMGFGIKKGRPAINNIDYLSTSRGSFV